MGMGVEAELVAAATRTYATKTETGDIQRCDDNGKVCYRDMATADACAVELRAAQIEQVPYPCRGHDHFHLATARRRPNKDERQQWTAKFAQVLLTLGTRGSTRDDLRKALGWDVNQPKKFRQMLAAFERARLVDCEGQQVLVRERRRPVLVQVALTGRQPQSCQALDSAPGFGD